MVAHNPALHGAIPPPTPGRPPVPRSRRLVLPTVLGLAVAGLGLYAVNSFSNPLEEKVVDRSTTPLLLALDDLHEYHAATGTFQVVIDQERDTRYVPSVISGERTSFLATGTVDAYVDFTDLGPERVTLSADGSSATVALPAPRLADPRIDPEQSRVLDRDRGVLDRIGDALGDDTSDDSALYALADDRLVAAAAASDLHRWAEDGARDMLTALAHSFGVDDVTVTFEPAPQG